MITLGDGTPLHSSLSPPLAKASAGLPPLTAPAEAHFWNVMASLQPQPNQLLLRGARRSGIFLSIGGVAKRQRALLAMTSA
jgi:hypothetical protein